MTSRARSRWQVTATSLLLLGLLSAFALLPARSAVAGTFTTTTLPCQSPKLQSDYQIDQCLVTQMKTITARMNTSLRRESNYFRYATRARDWHVARQTQTTFMAYAREVCLAQTNPYSSGTIEPILYGECALQLFQQRLSQIQRAISSFRNGGEARRQR